MNYIIEGNIDFYLELQKPLQSYDISLNHNNDICLITHNKLDNNFVTLECGHKFNYKPLYYDIYNHKTKFNFMEHSLGKLEINQIRCPYCRNKQNTLLPYYEELQLPQINGINFIYENDIKYKLIKRPCNFNNCNNNEVINKKKNKCYYCVYHSIIKPEKINNNTCGIILKSGVNKNNKCKLKIWKDCICKRHYNLTI